MTDWPAIIGPVAEALLGEPTNRTRNEWRYRTRGSLTVHVDGERAGTWRDWEADTGGGVLALVEHERGCDKAAALEWLESAGFVEGRDRVRRPVARPESFSAPEPTDGGASKAGESPPDGEADARAALVRRLWTRAVPADPTAGRVYLALRFAWPPAGIGPELPATVRWLARGGEPRSYWPGVPDAAGALAFTWRRPDGELATLTLMAVSAAGERVLWQGRSKSWVLPGTSRTGTAFETRAPSCDADPVHVAEGEADALALALAPWCGPGGVYAAGGTSGLHGVARGNLKLLGRGPVVIHADEGGQGCKAAGEAQARIQAAGRECRVEWYAGDPADALAEWIGARAAIREYEGGEAREAADRGAWHDLLSEVSPDGP